MSRYTSNQILAPKFINRQNRYIYLIKVVYTHTLEEFKLVKINVPRETSFTNKLRVSRKKLIYTT